MYRMPVSKSSVSLYHEIHRTLTSKYIRSSFIDYFAKNHGHVHVKSSSVVPLCDPTVPFVNAGMNQFKGVFLGLVGAPCTRAVNSQKCVRVGGKHNDLEFVGMDGHHHTFFEMLGNWSFGDYYKKKACQMAWDLLLGPFRLKPENLVVTYFGGDVVIGLPEDRECRDIWKSLGVPESRLQARGATDNFWEMGPTGPCGGCTEIHYMSADGKLTEIWNLVFIDHNREADGSVKRLRRQHVDTGMGLERMTALMQGVPSNYDTDLFRPLLDAIHKHSKGVAPYGGRYDADSVLDQAYRRLADHARMISVCLADGVFPAASLNLKQIMRKTFKICTDVFQNPQLLTELYTEVAASLGETYPELVSKQKDANIIIEHEREAYAKLRADIGKKWKGLVQKYPEVESLGEVDSAGFALGYNEFKESMSKLKTSSIPGELVFKMYDTHGFREELIERIAKLNKLDIDKKEFWRLLSQHKSKHKTAFKEQSAKSGLTFDAAIEKLIKSGVKHTDDSHKYNYSLIGKRIEFQPLRSNLVAIINCDGEWIDCLDPCEDQHYYLITDTTNFYCEEGGQAADTGILRVNDKVHMRVDSVFKIRDFVFHKGYFVTDKSCDKCYIRCKSKVTLEIDSERRLRLMRNHTAVHLLNAAIRKVLPNSVVCQIGSRVTDKGLSLNLSVYGEKLSQEVLLEAQELVRASIQSDSAVSTRVMDSVQLQLERGVLTVPGEAYPERDLRLVVCDPPLESRELCCGTHVPSCGHLREFCVSGARGAGGNAPALHALAGDAALEAHELFCHVEKLSEVIEFTEAERVQQEVSAVRARLAALCGPGAPGGQHATCLQQLRRLEAQAADGNDTALHGLAEAEIEEAVAEARRSGRGFAVQFVRSSYLMAGGAVRAALAGTPPLPALLLACSGGVIRATAAVPQEYVTEEFTAERWLRCILPVFSATLHDHPTRDPRHFAEMAATKASLITCEQLVQDAMRVAIKFAQSHVRKGKEDRGHSDTASKDRRQN
ncbi:alanine--tRNA ligase, mitochondrial [Battus philenor]|uniref:alanine--tRNA ligase, mitochondrial n=1 Tax=Battus philenor TaxID=42288 RepID=UPI0035D026CA